MGTPTSPPSRRPPAAIIVAGGRSSRFGGDKLSARLHGRTLLDATLAAVAGCEPVVLVSATCPTVAEGVVTVSEHPRWGGPAAAIVAGAAALPREVDETLIIAADLVDPEAAVAALLAIGHGVLADETGRAQWLLARVPARALHERIARLEAEGAATGRPAASITGELGLPIVPARAEAIADIDLPEDLDRMKEQHR
ncbi:NTP transferase domain-containing protein [Leifsonia shinshuensis]|uniref:NTP transferase domain-containing protein n=1 Tax=Leifsonia shinshuensis TaxID=150026 RepID=UPI001F50827F|nr:NTP transferase domain-containing protein [Leifsonia shinshuensis]MCI0158397.1 NTP transferase domain-containing protein [Leifsonia shinshuensis]